MKCVSFLRTQGIFVDASGGVLPVLVDLLEICIELEAPVFVRTIYFIKQTMSWLVHKAGGPSFLFFYVECLWIPQPAFGQQGQVDARRP